MSLPKFCECGAVTRDANAQFCTSCGKFLRLTETAPRLFPAWLKVTLIAVAAVVLVGISLSALRAPGVAPAPRATNELKLPSHQQIVSALIERFESDGIATKVDLQRCRMWVTKDFRAMSFADQEWNAKVMHDAMPDAAHCQLLLVSSKDGSYYGSYDPDLGLVIKAEGKTIGEGP